MAAVDPLFLLSRVAEGPLFPPEMVSPGAGAPLLFTAFALLLVFAAEVSFALELAAVVLAAAEVSLALELAAVVLAAAEVSFALELAAVVLAAAEVSFALELAAAVVDALLVFFCVLLLLPLFFSAELSSLAVVSLVLSSVP